MKSVKKRLRFSLILLIVTATSCWNHTNNNTSVTDSTVTTTNTNIVKRSVNTALLSEDFEQGSKAAYTGGSITFKSGDWYLADALVGTTVADAKHGSKSIRIRDRGRLAMQFDVNGVKRVIINYAAYSHDAASSWQLWMSANGGHTWQQVDSTITTSSHTLQQAIFTITQLGSIRLEILKVSGGKNRINIDDITINPPNDNFAQNTTQPVPGDDGNLLLGNPSSATSNLSNADNYLIDHQYYIESYNRDKGEPNWVSWHIDADDLGSTDRLNDFRPDTDLPAGWLEVDPDFYKNTGFDKGHNCPSGDRTSSTAANSATFLTDNMIPQAPNNNQHTWEHFESYCRDQVRDKGNEVYVIMGSYGSGGTGRNGYATSIYNGKINVPAHIWKVAVIIPNGNNDLARAVSSAHIIAINTPNDNSLSPNWMNYVCTVKDIEQATGYHLLSALPIPAQHILAAQYYKGGN